MRHGSLFSGYGGIDRAIADVFGAETAWVSDVDPGANQILAHRYPDAPNLGDITKVDWSTVEPVDIISGGSPCQDLSMAGRRAGMTPGTRSNLWGSMREAIAVIRPSFVVWENVHGALSANASSSLEHCPGCMGGAEHGGPVLRALGRVLGDLADLGFDAQWHGLRAADVGACHGRFRVFVLAYANEQRLRGRPDSQGAAPAGRHGHPVAGAGGPDLALLPTPTSSDTNGAGAHGTGGADLRTTVALLPTPRESASGREDGHEWMMLHLGHADAPESVPGQDLRDMREVVQPQAFQREAGRPSALPEQEELLPVVRELQEGGDPGCASLASPEAPRGDVRGVRHDGGPARSPRRPEPGEQQPGELDDAVRLLPPEAALAGGSREAACGCAAWGHYAPAIHRHELALGRIAPPPTEAGPSGKPRLSARAAEWMMMLPAGWVTDVPGVTRNQALKALGNGVVPPQAAAALRLMLDRIKAGWTVEW